MLDTSTSFLTVLSTENEQQILSVCRCSCIESLHSEGTCLSDPEDPRHNCCNPCIREDIQHSSQPRLVVVVTVTWVVLVAWRITVAVMISAVVLTIDSLFLSATFADLGISVPLRTNFPSSPLRSASRKQSSVFVLQFVCHCMQGIGDERVGGRVAMATLVVAWVSIGLPAA